MTKLNQVIAIEKGIKAKAEKKLTEAHHGLKKTDLLTGISRQYKPIADDRRATAAGEQARSGRCRRGCRLGGEGSH